MNADADSQERERRVKEYEATLAMLKDTGQTVWVINGSYLLAETVMVGLLAQGLGSERDLHRLLALGAVLGAVISFLWWASFERAYAFYNLRMNFARELEDALGYRVLTKGKDLSDGRQVRVGGRDVQIPLLARRPGIRDWTRGLIAVFGAAFVGTLLYALSQNTGWAAPVLLASLSSKSAQAAAGGLPTDVIAALWGALAGAASSVVIEVGKWFFKRRRRAKAIKLALYWEIFGHSIFEVDASPAGEPNFVLLGFERASYDAYLAEIPDLLPEKLVGEIATYYMRVTTAAAQQQQIDEDALNVNEATQKVVRAESSQTITHPVHPDEVNLLKLAAQQVGERVSKLIGQNRILLAFAMWEQEQLLATLQREFKHDPARKPVKVLPKYQEWAKTIVGQAVKGTGEPRR